MPFQAMTLEADLSLDVAPGPPEAQVWDFEVGLGLGGGRGGAGEDEERRKNIHRRHISIGLRAPAWPAIESPQYLVVGPSSSLPGLPLNRPCLACH